MSSVDTGRAAEEAVADYLAKKSYKIIGRNWRIRWCEIDVIAEKNDCVFFIEVKYRKNDLSGTGFQYITREKLRRMDYAAKLWVARHAYLGPYRLCASSVRGEKMNISFAEIML